MTGAWAKDRRRAQIDLARLEAEEDLDLAYVAEEAGDRPLTASARKRHETESQRRGSEFEADLLFALTNRRYTLEVAVTLWREIVAQKEHLAGRVGRNRGVAVAALDYLSNAESQGPDPGLISASRLAAVAEVALRDALTGLYDRAAFRARLDGEIQRFERFGEPVSLLMIDIDRFKRFNETFGHPRGDEALREVSRTIRAETRAVDLAARYGGEEFAVIVPSTDGTEALTLAERIRKRVEERFRDAGGLTVSVGIADCPDDGERPRDLVQATDEGLYAAKRAGRNRKARCPTGSQEAP